MLKVLKSSDIGLTVTTSLPFTGTAIEAGGENVLKLPSKKKFKLALKLNLVFKLM